MVKLDAVNYLLGVLGSAPVSDLLNKNPDVDTAAKALEAAVVSVTSRGYWFNEVYDVSFAPDPTTKFIDTTGYTKLITRSEYAVVRGQQLFSPLRNSYQFDTAVIAQGIEILDFDILPDSVQNAVQYWAGIQLCTVELEDNIKRGEMQEFYNDAYIQLKLEEREIKRTNQLTAPRVRAALYRVRPANFNSGGGPNFGGR